MFAYALALVMCFIQSLCCCACRYTEVRRRISDKYAEIENQLINEFIDAQMTLDTKRMKMYAHALVPFSYVSPYMNTSNVQYSHKIETVYQPHF